MPLPDPIIVVPGVTATYLRDLYPLPPEAIWTVLTKNFDRAQMHPDNLRFEAAQPALTRAGQIYEIAYEELIEELRYNLTKQEDEPVPVFPFGYDWRHPLAITEEELAAFVDEVIERTKLIRHYNKDGYSKRARVNLVGHSMGGLVISGYVERFGAAKVHKVATLATPYKGSFEAIVKMATGTANIGGSMPSSREREAARMTPSLYHLLPSFETGTTVDKGAGLPRSTFKPGLWQPSIIKTIVTYIDRHSVKRAGRKADRQKQGEALFKKLLSEAEKHRQRIEGLDLAKAGIAPENWLCVAGVDAKTRVQMHVEVERGKPFFRLTSDDRLNEWKNGDEKIRMQTGDGTVHLEGAVPNFLSRENLVCVTPDDYGYWEIADKAATKAAGFHGILPNMNMLHRLLVRHFAGWPDPKEITWGRPLPGVDDAAWHPAVWPLKNKSLDD